MKNENVLNDMVDIVDELHKYIPKTTSVQTFQVNTEGGGSEVVTLNIDHFYHILIGGYQLTAARIRGGQGILSNSINGWERGEGLIPIIEDWHTKLCYMKVVYGEACM